MCTKKTALTLLLGCLVLPASAAIDNGGFEQWTGNSPNGWDTIDTGISVSQDNTTVYNGSSSARVQVNTGSQASTDFRQQISVTAGETYNFSVRVYHTEGNVKARLYINNYLGYSNESLTGQWQELSQSYTASTTGSIEVGLRFYDVSGFDGSEVVYVDEFLPSSGSGGSGGGSGGSCEDVSVTINTDNYGYETSWEITDTSSAQVAAGSGYGNSSSYQETVCLEDGNYQFIISDSYGDGMCCSYGNGSYDVSIAGQSVASGGSFAYSESTSFTVGSSGGGGGSGDLESYYSSTSGLSGFALKSELYNIIKDHNNQGYGALWTFYEFHSLDVYYENDGSILDIYSEEPFSGDAVVYTKVQDQCGSYSGEGDCYNREHSFPKSWFGGKIEPMNSDVHHIFATDGFVNSKRGSYPFGEVNSASYTSGNGSRLGAPTVGLGYSGTVFEPIDEFKGDLARAYFYMATRYENVIAGWENISSYGDAVLNGSSNQVFENWYLDLMKQWHSQDPVSQMEIDRNNAAQSHQGNRNPFVDHPEFVTQIWGN
ncbi:MAG: endonuclease [Aestuariibacter sp.]